MKRILHTFDCGIGLYLFSSFFIIALLAMPVFPYAGSIAQELNSKEKFYTIQISSFPVTEKQKAIRTAEEFLSWGFKDVRVELIDNYLIIRAGFFKEKKEAEELLTRIVSARPGAFLRTGYYRPERIIFPTEEKKNSISRVDKHFLEGKTYRLFPFKEETSFIFPINEYSFWFYLNPKLEFESPSYLSLIYTCSDVILKNKGFITVLLNGYPVSSRRLLSERKEESTTWKIEIPIKFFKKGFNELKIVSRHYTTEELCADSENVANWIRFSPHSALFITRKPVKNLYLSLYPFPYLDNLESEPVQSTWIINKKYTPFDVGLLLSLATNWGIENTTLPLKFRIKVADNRFKGNEILFESQTKNQMSDTEKEVGFINSTFIQKEKSNYARLIISGSDEKGYTKSIEALTNKMTAACDSTKMTVKNVPEKYIPVTKGPYQLTTFNEMGISPVLIEGAFLQEKKILIHRPVMTPIGKGSCFVIKFKHSAALKPELSILNFFINDVYISSVRLTEDNKDNGEIILPIPLTLLGEPGWLITLKAFHYIGAVDCGKSYKEFAWTLIEDTSYVKLVKGLVKGYPYINYFPFIKQEFSLNPKSVTMWLPLNPSETVLTTAAIIAARAGQVNRVPIKWNVVFGDEIDKTFSHNCIIVIGDKERIRRIKNLVMNFRIIPSEKELEIDKHLPLVEESLKGKVIVQAVESPWNERCVIYSITANDKELEYFNEVLLDKKKYDLFVGDIALINAAFEVHSFNSRQNKIFEEIEKERNRYTLPMKMITSAVVLVIVAGLFIFIRYFAKAISSKKPK